MDQATLKGLLHYDPEHGLFTWRTMLCRRNPVGAPAGCRELKAVRIRIRGKAYMAHRLAWLYMTGAYPANFIDHINGDPFDNRWSNLRDVTLSENSQNQRRAHSRSKSGLLGASKNGKRWLASISVQGRGHTIGYFDTAEAAHLAYIAAKRRLHAGCTV